MKSLSSAPAPDYRSTQMVICSLPTIPMTSKPQAEMVHVLKSGGHVLACGPNRHFPFDIFHGREIGSYIPKFSPPGSRFLFSVDDYRKMFEQGGCGTITALPVQGFWDFVTMRKSLKGQLFSAPIRLVFFLVSQPLRSFLRGTCTVPWISAGGQKT
jgi:hypothetical protein